MNRQQNVLSCLKQILSVKSVNPHISAPVHNGQYQAGLNTNQY